MALGFGIIGAGGIPVNSTQSGELAISPTLVVEESGFVSMVCERDPGDITGIRDVKAIDASDDYRMRVGIDTFWFNEVFPGAALDSARWTTVTATMTTTVTAGFTTLNAGLSTAINAVDRLQTYRSFPAYVTFPVAIETLVQFSQLPVLNNVCEWGVFISSGTSAPTDGAFFRLNAAGEFRCVINNNGTELQSNTLDFNTLVGSGITRHFVIELGFDEVTFWIDAIEVAKVGFTTAGGKTTASMNLPMAFRIYNAAATATAQTMKVSSASVNIEDSQTTRSWPITMCGSGGMGYQGQPGGTMGSTSNIVNNTNPTVFTATNTTGTSTGQLGLGGLYNFTATVAAATDYIISSYVLPAGTAAIPGKSLYITGIKISSVNLGTTVATTATVISWTLCFGHTAVTLATTESGTAKAARRIALGLQAWPIGALAGAMAEKGDIQMQFTSPVYVQPGEYVQVAAKFVLGTATASQSIYSAITYDAFWE